MSLNEIAKQLVAKGKGILAADESTGTIEKRLASINVENTEVNRQTYREMLFTAEGMEKYISGVILYDETLRQSTRDGVPFVKILNDKGVIPGIKVDQGVKELEGSPEEKITVGLDGLGERLKEYYALGARFAKWRGVIKITETLPTEKCILENAKALAKYAKLCQENNLVPIVEPEVLMDGDHSIEKCFEITKKVQETVFAELRNENVDLTGILLKPNMVIYSLNGAKVSSGQVAEKTLECLRLTVPAEVPGMVFLSGGQSEAEACENLNAINLATQNDPWELSYSYGRALQATALKTWGGKSENFELGQKAFVNRAKLVSLARSGEYDKSMED